VSNEITLGNTSVTRFRIPGLQSSATNGQVLTYNSTSGIIEFQTASGGATSINGLSDGYADTTSVGLGSGALDSDDGTSNKNTAVGVSALENTTTGYQNNAIGYHSLRLNTTGYSNIGIGNEVLYSNTTGANNIAIGYGAMNSNTTGISNTVVGSLAMLLSTTAQRNTTIGFEGLRNITTGSYNTSVGYFSLRGLTTGSNNTSLGYRAGDNVTTGTNITAVGFEAFASAVTATNEITLGNSSIATLRCQVTSITSLSDARDKTDVAPLQAGLNFVERLDPVSFTWNMRDGGKVGVPDTGFIAQELQQVQDDTGVTIPGLVFDENPEKLEAAYGKLVPVLVKAIQELSAKVTELEAQLNTGD
jgi:hypothetical protein